MVERLGDAEGLEDGPRGLVAPPRDAEVGLGLSLCVPFMDGCGAMGRVCGWEMGVGLAGWLVGWMGGWLVGE